MYRTTLAARRVRQRALFSWVPLLCWTLGGGERETGGRSNGDEEIRYTGFIVYEHVSKYRVSDVWY